MDIVRHAHIERAEAAVVEARRHFQIVSADVAKHIAKKQAILERANEADRSRDRLDADRRELLPRLKDGDPTAAEALSTIGAAIARAQQSATDLREAAALCDPDIDAAGQARMGVTKRLGEAEYHLAWLRHALDAQNLESAFGKMMPAVRNFIETGVALEQEHRRVFNAPLRVDAPPLRRIARFLSVWSRAILGDDEQHVLIRGFSASDASLIGAIEVVRFQPVDGDVTVTGPDTSAAATCG